MGKFALLISVILSGLISTEQMHLSTSEATGFSARITEHGLKYASTEAINALSKTVQGLKIPDQSGRTSGVAYSVSGMTITQFTKPASNIDIVQNTGLKWSVGGTGIAMRGNWRYKYKKGWFKISDHGSFDASANGISFSLTMAIGKDSNGRPKLSASGCTCSINSLRIKFHGGASWIYNMFSHVIENKIKGVLRSQLCNVAVRAVNVDGEKKLQNLPVTVVLAKKFDLDYSLTNSPKFTNTYMQTFHKGEIFWKGNRTEAPFQPAPIPMNKNSSKMVYLWLSDYMANSMGYNAMKHGYLKYNLTAKDLPAAEKSVLNTTCTDHKCIGTIIPQIGSKYPNHQVKITMVGTKAPSMVIDGKDIQVNGVGTVDLYAQQAGKKDVFLLSLNVSLGFNIYPSLKGQLLYGSVASPKLELTVLKSDVGTIMAPILKLMIQLAINAVVLPQLNAEGSKGFPLPTTNEFTWTNSVLLVQKHSLMIATDVVYKPKMETEKTIDYKEPVFQVVP